MAKPLNKKPILPPKALGKGDTVQVGDMIGTVSGDHLSPGGMRGFLEVTFYVAFHGDDGMFVYVRRMQVPLEKLTSVNVPRIPFDATGEGDMSTAANYISYNLEDDGYGLATHAP